MNPIFTLKKSISIKAKSSRWNTGDDLVLVQYAGLCVWTDNVYAELRAFGDVVVASNNDDGVAEVVQRFI